MFVFACIVAFSRYEKSHLYNDLDSYLVLAVILKRVLNSTFIITGISREKTLIQNLDYQKLLTNVNVVDRHLHVCEFFFVSVCVYCNIWVQKLLYFFGFGLITLQTLRKTCFMMLKVALLNNGLSSCELELEQFKTKSMP